MMVRLAPDYETFRRRMEEAREREAAEVAGRGGASGASATEPVPGSSEHQAAGAQARGLVAERDATEARRPAAARSSVTRSASVAVPGAPALPAAGAVLGEIGQAAWEVSKTGAGLLMRAAPAAAGIAAAAPVLLVPGNSEAELHLMGEDLRVRTAPGQRSATVQRRADEGFFGTGIAAKWVGLPVRAEWASDEQTGRRYIAVDRLDLEQAIGSDVADAALGSIGVAMAKPRRRVIQAAEICLAWPQFGIFRQEAAPDSRDDDPKPPLNPAPLVVPAVKGFESPRIESEEIRIPSATEAGDGYGSYGAFRWKYKSAGFGYEWHHIVSRHAKNIERFGADKIHNESNIVRLPKEIHWRINARYDSKPSFANGVTVRVWLLKNRSRNRVLTDEKQSKTLSRMLDRRQDE